MLVFLVLDGVATTVRKARAKYEEARYVADYHSALVAGETMTGHTVVGLATRVPRSSQLLLVHESLVVETHRVLSPNELDEMAILFLARLPARSLLDQSYLYRGAPPPKDLGRVLTETVSGDEKEAPANRLRVKSDRTISPRRLTAPDDLATILIRRRNLPSRGQPVCLLGAGDYVRSTVIPSLLHAGAALHTVVDREPQIALFTGHRYGFYRIGTDAPEAIASLPDDALVVVATAHDSHAELAAQALRAGHRVFVEKPPIVTLDDMRLLLGAANERPGYLEVGFNRRYAPAVVHAQNALAREDGPITMIATVKEVPLRPTHWYFWPNQGTRVTGNLCHWIDLGVAMVHPDAQPVEVAVSPVSYGSAIDEERVISATFDDGSMISITATGRGDGVRGVQERVEIRRGGTTVWIDDLRRVRVLRKGFGRTYRHVLRDKGHERMYRAWMARTALWEPSNYPGRDIVRVGAIQLAAATAVRGALAQTPSEITELVKRL